MKIAFLGYKKAFDYFQIGGTESFFRRISIKFIQEGIKVDYILYGDKNNKEISPLSGMTLRYFKSFEDALEAVDEEYKHVVTIYILPKDRFKYALFRKNKSKSIIFHFIYFSWPDLLIKRYLYFLEARIFPYNGKLFCISKRQYEYVRKWTKNVIYVFPPVPVDFFLTPKKKPRNEIINIAFLGRINSSKGAKDVINIFRRLESNNKYKCCIYGIHMHEDKKSEGIHKCLKTQNYIEYREVDIKNYSPRIEILIKKLLAKTDIVLIPYKRLSSTIDTPVTLLEAMASLCAVITKPFGNIPDIYGQSKFLISEKHFISQIIDLLENISTDEIIKERERIYARNKRLSFRVDKVTRKFLESIKE